ncbi:MAG: hypothetical protein COX81_03950 [Candidatus Magasanikbacteria bacterium CG_4_10_14_0_2_um_filter_37_12]|uniref:Uncharacterized protein n=1 Tax=Candidatus Magasanikbacteria bacterium CG_4_10_14_0_2_um_filter_37_12 TaxID=1974637 RepID=A0A2M7V6U9_9BACT|nr:MAG: hypothetical protein COX81_03950 [Candidatus Magasanikbacteria bacterium CG_4_10_14_0_2_um_filter_37_12]
MLTYLIHRGKFTIACCVSGIVMCPDTSTNDAVTVSECHDRHVDVNGKSRDRAHPCYKCDTGRVVRNLDAEDELLTRADMLCSGIVPSRK